MSNGPKPKVLKLYTSKLVGSDDTHATYAATTYEDTHGVCRFLGIYKGQSANIKNAVASRYNLSKKNIDLLPISGENFKSHWTPLES